MIMTIPSIPGDPERGSSEGQTSADCRKRANFSAEPNSCTITSKLPRVGTTIFTVMSSLASELGAVNLGQGFPDFPMSEKLISLVDEAMKGGFNQYAHMNGLPALRNVLAEK